MNKPILVVIILILAIAGLFAAAFIISIISSTIENNNPLKVCIDDRETPYKIKATLELIIDGQNADIPANIGRDGDCHRTIYTLTNDGTIYAEWEEEYSFELGHFLWIWEFPIRDMDLDKTIIYVNGNKSPRFINHPLQDGYHYKAEFTSKAYSESFDEGVTGEKYQESETQKHENNQCILFCDTTNYEPKWAKNIGKNQASNKCFDITFKDLFLKTIDGRWCNEFLGYLQD